MSDFIGKTLIETITKYKGHHIAFWAIYHFAWWSIYTGSIWGVLETFEQPYSIVKYLGYVIFQAFAVYFCLYVLIPRYLEKRQYLIFVGLLTLTIIVTSICISTNYYISGWIAGKSTYELFNIHPASFVTIFKQNAFPSSVAAMTLGMSIKLAKNWQESQKRQQILEKEKLETELKFLKSQFNPHFLFNTINSIFVLIDKNTEMASESLVKFSGLLRYQLYECNTSTIPLEKELSYIASFMELESLRQNENFNLETVFPQTLDKDLVIAPFILIPFIENAFKHLSEDKKLKKWIRLTINVLGNELIFNLTNSANYDVRDYQLNEKMYGGLGLKNVQRRLDILYPDNFTLLISKDEDAYAVQLKLNLQVKPDVQLKRITA
ncbi:hypothetical protein AWE51_02650 [Aquimarina aggregata]|uniref:Signal transduction histidine kinase internal region domain-containing protein n=1 Tax=Aquimarina aggregata TaxID=1642818 RepID=A0A162CX36_9FLAO|nr:histidine kinase [Aquimarina aggregata]KZS42359.1 hypothetical protein AWE51_02650 [Aquimarina aggregata]